MRSLVTVQKPEFTSVCTLLPDGNRCDFPQKKNKSEFAARVGRRFTFLTGYRFLSIQTNGAIRIILRGLLIFMTTETAIDMAPVRDPRHVLRGRWEQLSLMRDGNHVSAVSARGAECLWEYRHLGKPHRVECAATRYSDRYSNFYKSSVQFMSFFALNLYRTVR